MVHAPYRGAGSLRIDLMSGVVSVNFEGIVGSLPAIAAGSLFGLAVAAETRIAPAPMLPTFREPGHDMVIKNRHGLSGPSGIPAPTVQRLQAGLAEICARPTVLKQFATIGNFYVPMPGADFPTFVADQVDLWRPMIVVAEAVDK